MVRPELDHFLFLDVGDTLLHLQKDPAHVYYRILRDHGIINQTTPLSKLKAGFVHAYQHMVAKNPPDHLDRYQNHSRGNDGWWHELISVFLQKIGSNQQFTEPVFREIISEFSRTDTWKIDAGFDKLLAFCGEQQIQLGIISNWDLRLRPLLTNMGLIDSFEIILISAEFGYEKPSEKIFQQAAKLSGRAAQYLTYVGDKPDLDFYPSQKLGWDSYLISAKNPCPQHLPCINNLADLITKKDWYK